MVERIAAWAQVQFGIAPERTHRGMYRVAIVLASIAFLCIATVTVVYDDLFAASRSLDDLTVGSVAPYNIVSPQTAQFDSPLLTSEARLQASNSVQAVYDPPDPNIARQQAQLASQILGFIKDVREDSYGTPAQRLADLDAITTLSLDDTTKSDILQYNDDVWEAIATEILNTLALVMRESIREGDLTRLRGQLSNQVSVRFSEAERTVIVAVVEDLVRANTFLNADATEAAVTAASAQVAEITRSLVRGELIVSAGEVITPLSYEAMGALGLLQAQQVDWYSIAGGFLLTIIVMVTTGLYVAHFNPLLIYQRVRMFILLASVFLLVLIATRLFGINGNIYVFPTAILGLLFVAISGHYEAIIGTLALAMLTGYMANFSLEITSLVTVGGIIGALTLHRTERLNAFFVAGTIVGIANAAVVITFRLSTPGSLDTTGILRDALLALIGGAIVVPATTMALMFIISSLFNLPTTLRLIDLSQPNKPLLQRLLREAPGTYQHSLQVANLAEQAAERIGADAQLIYVAALYHDIGKMENPLFFTENQPDPALNPHNTLADPLRSATIIIEHVTEGDLMAKQNGLPHRIRDFIMEHHGTTKVGYFYKLALEKVDNDPNMLEVAAFTYPGPKPQTRESAVLMLADSCEATVRSRQPRTKAEIERIVDETFDYKRREHQLDECGLTLKDLAVTRETFIEILNGMYHHRVKYQEDTISSTVQRQETRPMSVVMSTEKTDIHDLAALRRTAEIAAARISKPIIESDEDKPLTEVPRLSRTEDQKSTNGSLKAVTRQPQEHDE